MSNTAIPGKLLLSEFLSNTPDHVYFKDLASRFIWVSASLARSLGLTVEQVVGRTDANFFGPEKARAYRETERKIMSTGEPLIDQLIEHTWPDGHITWSMNVAMPLRDHSGEIVGIWGTNKDVTEKVLMERALEKANQRANEMAERAVLQSQCKSRFLAIVSHEIRNPLNAVMGCAALLQDTPLDPMQRDYVETIEDGSRATLTLIKDLLDFAKIEAGGLELEQLEVNLPDTLEDVVRLVSFLAHAKALEIVLDIDPAVPEKVAGDPTRLTQILLNLGSNAAKFTEHGEVIVAVSVVDTGRESVNLRFEVRDTGIGIPADRIDAVFEPYTQADQSTTRHYGGTGLGLPIVKSIVELMGGITGVQSQEGLGSTFWFTASFPLIASAGEKRETPQPVLKGRVLVVDDHAIQRKVLARHLRNCGLQVVCTDSALEAMTILKQAYQSDEPIDAALLDHHMPGCDGAELARSIRCDARLSGTRLVLLTNSGRRPEEFGSMGLAAVLTKPATRRDLTDALILVLAGQAADWHSDTSSIITRRLLSAQRGREKHHILVAEDVDAGRKVACHTLRRLGYRATGVANGREAIAAWETGQYQLILMDCEMPTLDGYEATREIRRRELLGQHIPIVALTGRVMPGAEVECLDAGMDAYFVKPFDRDRLEACLDRLLGCDRIDTGKYPIVLKSPPESESVLVDLQALRVLACGDEVFMRELIRDFVEQGTTAADEIEAALEQQDATGLARVAHALKTASGALGAKQLHTSVEQLERAARKGVVDRGLAGQVQRDISGAMECLRTWSART